MTGPDGLVCETPRLALRLARPGDAAFLLQLVNQRSWIDHIGDRHVHTLEEAAHYIDQRLLAPFRALGYGMYILQRKSDGTPVGLCGLVKRDTLPDPDLGFALLDAYAGQGYAVEAATAVVRHARETLGIQRLLAITTPGNQPSGRLLVKLGFQLQDAPHVTPEGERLLLYAC